MNIIVTVALVGATLGACVGYAISSWVDFSPYLSTLIGAVIGAISPFTGDGI